MKRKIVFFVNSLYGGGAEKVLQTLLRHLDPHKFDITLYSLHKDKLDKNYPSNIAFRYIFGHSKWRNYIKILIYNHFSPSLFYRLFVRGKYDTEVAFIEGYSTRIVSGSTNSKSKKIAWVHIDLQNNHWTDIAFHNRKEEDTCYKMFDAVVAVSETARQASLNLFPGIKRAIVLYNPIDSREIILKSKEKDLFDVNCSNNQ